MLRLTIADRAYIAGLFDGEGCVSFRDRKTQRPRLKITQKDPEVLEWVRETIGFGNLYRKGTGYDLCFGSKADVLDFIEVIYPYSRVKESALKAARDNLSE